MIENSKIDDLKWALTREAVRAVTTNESVNEAEHRAKLEAIGRTYTLHVKAIDPEGREVLSLTKLCLERDLPGKVISTPEIREILELLIEAAGEWSA
jgi:hypothetical protein